MGLLFNIKDEVEECNITVKVDIVNRNEVAKSYADGIEQDKIEV